MNWFGDPWPHVDYRASICDDDAFRVPVPIGTPCMWCNEPLDAESRGIFVGCVLDTGEAGQQPVHIECQYRQVVGGPAHLRHTCTCQGGTDDPDQGMTPRQAALYVWERAFC